MKTNKTEIAIINGVEVEVSDLLLNMNVSNPIIGGESMVNVNMRFRPFAIVDGVKVETPDLNDRPLLVADMVNCNDEALLVCFQKIQNAIQEYVLLKNI